MVNNVKIGGVTVDADDPCALHAALVKSRLRLITGEGINEVSIQDFNGHRRTRYSISRLADLDKEIARQKDLCEQSTGARKARFAMRAGFRKFP